MEIRWLLWTSSLIPLDDFEEISDSLGCADHWEDHLLVVWPRLLLVGILKKLALSSSMSVSYHFVFTRCPLGNNVSRIRVCVQLKSWLYSDLNLHVITATRKGKGLPKRRPLSSCIKGKVNNLLLGSKMLSTIPLRDLSPCNNGHLCWETKVTIEKCEYGKYEKHECDHYYPETIVTMKCYTT